MTSGMICRWGTREQIGTNQVQARASFAFSVALLSGVFLTVVGASSAQSQQPDRYQISELCFAVAEQTRDPQGVRYYRHILFKLAGVDPTIDDEAVTARKMQLYWNTHQDDLYCSNMSSMIGDAHILRLAVERSSSDFVNDVVRRWRLDLNHQDRRSGGTVSDYLNEEISKATGTPRENSLRRFQTLFSRNGGRRAADLALTPVDG